MPSLPLRGMAVVVGLALISLSCGKSGPKLYPVSGKVFYLGKPAAGARVVLQPAGKSDETIRPTGEVGADGAFTLETYPHGKGVPQGEYHILFSWDDSTDRRNPKSKLPPRYADPAFTQIKVTVKEEPLVLEPFMLTR